MKNVIKLQSFAGANPLMCARTIDNINIRAKILLIAWDTLYIALGRTFRDIFLMKQLNFLIYYQTRELRAYMHTHTSERTLNAPSEHQCTILNACASFAFENNNKNRET